ncbi:MAG: GAF domain-containing protein [Eubacteriales bacterium]
MSYQSPVTNGRDEKLKLLPDYLRALLEGEPDLISNLSNASALIFDLMDGINWAGFYRVKGDALLLSPFQGKPACVRIRYGKGVCGTAWKQDQTTVVPDVHAFPGHIACDSDSRSEIVVVLHNPDGSVFGVLDLDSPEINRFGDAEKSVLEEVGRILEERIGASVT